MPFSFSVEKNLANCVQMGDLEALFRGLRAALVQLFERAKGSFQKTQHQKHPLEKNNLNFAAARSKSSSLITMNYLTVHEKLMRIVNRINDNLD